MGVIAKFIISILLAIAVMVAAFWAVPFTWGAAVANTVIFIAISIPMAIILAFMTNILKINSGLKIPKVKCFDKNTLIEMDDGSFKKIININVGDKLKHNNKVTAKFKLTTEGSIMYTLNGVIVSNSHIVKYKNKWIYVSDHPNAVKIKLYNEPYLYCLNTTNKIIQINEILFTDWDEIYNDTLTQIINHTPNKNINDIHKYFDYGFTPNTQLKLKNGVLTNICNININDTLENGEKVYGLVEINCNDINEQHLNRYILGNNSYIDGININSNAHNLFNENLIIKLNNPLRDNKLYNLLTDKGSFQIKNRIFFDYNSAIDQFFKK
jgi:hypothetical protein